MKKIIIISGIIFLLAILVFVFFFINLKKTSQAPEKAQTNSTLPTEPVFNINGLIKEATADKVSVFYGSTTLNFKITPETKISADLKEGQAVSIVSKTNINQPSNLYEAISITVQIQNNVTGTISSINNGSLTVAVSLPTFLAGKQYQFLISSDTPISAAVPKGAQNPFPGKISLSDLKVGMKVSILENRDILTSTALKAQFINIIL